MVILFDGVCNLCNGFVKLILENDKKRVFQFASLQSKYGTGLSNHFNLPVAKPETIVLYDGKNIFTESKAVIKIFHSLGGIWKSSIIFYIIPSIIRNSAYRLIARNRYALCGKNEQCMVLDWDVKEQFIDNTLFIKS